MFAGLVGEAWAWILSPVRVVREASVARADEGNIKMLVGIFIYPGAFCLLFLSSLNLHSLRPRGKLGCTHGAVH